MFNTKTIAFAAAALAFATVGIQAANAAPRHEGIRYYGGSDAWIVRSRIRNQARRIRRGRRSGRLNWVEARRVSFELSHIRGFMARYMSDDRLSFREGRHMHRLLNQNGRRIRRFGHNGWQHWRRSRNQRPVLSRYNGFE